MSDTPPDHAGDGGQHRPPDRLDAGTDPPGGHNSARPVREFRIRGADRAGNAIFSLLTRAGIGPAHLLTTRGRRTGRPRTNPVFELTSVGEDAAP